MFTRRKFLKLAAVTVGFFFATPILRARAKKVALTLDMIPELKTVKGWKIIKIKGSEVLIIRDTENSVRALNPVCTHKKGIVNYHPDLNKIKCPKHRSLYHLDGSNISGPSKIPLQTFSSELKGDKIIIDLPEV